jgi:hypothetical protein
MTDQAYKGINAATVLVVEDSRQPELISTPKSRSASAMRADNAEQALRLVQRRHGLVT